MRPTMAVTQVRPNRLVRVGVGRDSGRYLAGQVHPSWRAGTRLVTDDPEAGRER